MIQNGHNTQHNAYLLLKPYEYKVDIYTVVYYMAAMGEKKKSESRIY